MTGAAQGLGRACAEHFLDAGAKVVRADLDVESLGPTAVSTNSCCGTGPPTNASERQV
ncbi:hypothetical protein [Neoroseomonas soli]|uniref:hypothetical protein n=1 Tax=Neoroseomonas soli TaxID=1081025 RepID=UPI0038CF3440